MPLLLKDKDFKLKGSTYLHCRNTFKALKVFSNIVQIYFHKIHDLPCPGQARDNVPECRKALRENDGKSSNHSNFACACNFEEMPIFVLCLRFWWRGWIPPLESL